VLTGFVLLTGSGARATSRDDARTELAMLEELDSELQRLRDLLADARRARCAEVATLAIETREAFPAHSAGGAH
jgi:hypothetical protein